MAESTTMGPMETIGHTQALKRLAASIPAGTAPAEDDGQPWNQETEEDRRVRLATRHASILARWTQCRPLLYRDADVGELDPSQHGEAVAGWLLSGGMHLVLAGPVGTGKTYAAYAIGNQAVGALALTVEAWTVHDLLQGFRPGGDPTSDRAFHSDLLILDDLDATATEWEAETLTALLDARVREERRTIVTTNITGDQITEAWGSRLMDRLRYRLTALTFVGESRRKADW